MDEVWKIIEQFPNYSVSNFGRVKRNKTGRILKYGRDKSGYLQVHLHNNPISKVLKVHKLVAVNFISNPNGYTEVDHIDTIVENNNSNNLRWITHTQNQNNPITRIKLKNVCDSIRIVRPILQYDLDNILVNEWSSAKEVEDVLGFNHSNITTCCKGRTKTAYGFIWRYKL